MVDVVYLWVDGSDPLWQRNRSDAYDRWILQNPNELAKYGDTAGRYRDNGELRYNLRALERFFPSVNHVYVVTAGQVPSWLRPSELISIVDYRELAGSSGSLAFDSGNIESLIHHISGLSERFFYLNDDVFFGAPVDTTWWFEPRLKVFAQPTETELFDDLQVDATAMVNASIQSRQWLSARYDEYLHDRRLLAHAPRPMLRTRTAEMEREAPELFAQLRSTTFRSWRIPPIVADLIPRWMVHLGIAERVEREPLYISTGEPEAAAQFDDLIERFGFLEFFCINDTCDDALPNDPRLQRVAETLQGLLPTPSRYEQAAN
jgi:Stealth protein CR2, conserved region 2/Stealth protein CR1, conserved region 1/Stealth protein CR4, conserved region 4